jgi:hypothetical protein
VALATAGVIAAAVPASASPAVAKPHALGPGWTEVSLEAQYGGGCAEGGNGTNLSPIVDFPCNVGVFIWYERSLGDGKIELVNDDGSEAFGFSGGEFKLETPNIKSTYLNEQEIAGDTPYADFANAAETGWAGPSGKDDPLAVTPAPTYQSGWHLTFF